MSNPVVTHQPGSGGYGTNVQTGEWSTGLCSCFSDLFVCKWNTRCFGLVEFTFCISTHRETHDNKGLYFIILSCKYILIIHICCTGAVGCICPLALSCYTASKYGENCFLGCLPGGMTAIRTHMRLTYGIQVSNKVILLCVLGGIVSHLTKQSCSGISSLLRKKFSGTVGRLQELGNFNCNTFPYQEEWGLFLVYEPGCNLFLNCREQ